ncbi:MAG: putative baseplate assembly protein, partial [Acidobacteria bacterium]
MPLPIPNLDDKTFEQLVEEARALIPRFTKEWTDHNIHDPGITFIELFAWLAEIQNYRLNQVTDKNYQQFFKLIGLSPRPTIPARMDIAFTLEKGDDQGPLIPAGTKIVPAGKEDFVFETSADFFLTKTVLEAVKSYQNGRIVDHTKADKTGNI